MPTTEQVMQALSKVQDPELGRDLVSLKMIRDLVIQDGVINFTLYLTIPNCPLKDHMAKDAAKHCCNSKALNRSTSNSEV
jgi:ATP-binding protein involved in chromosome partitioning